jgi:hypothetical protein
MGMEQLSMDAIRNIPQAPIVWRAATHAENLSSNWLETDKKPL